MSDPIWMMHIPKAEHKLARAWLFCNNFMWFCIGGLSVTVLSALIKYLVANVFWR
jgi:hypothetical protein